MTTREERNAYSRGYFAGLRGHWPIYLPPTIPNTEQQRLVDAAVALSQRVDEVFATTFDEEDRENDFAGLESARLEVLRIVADVRLSVTQRLEASNDTE